MVVRRTIVGNSNNNSSEEIGDERADIRCIVWVDIKGQGNDYVPDRKTY
jgi:hypothetical protein